MTQQQIPPQPDLPYPGDQPSAAPPKTSRRNTVIAAAIAGVVGILIGSGITAAAMSGGDEKPVSSVSAPTTAPATTEPPAVEETTTEPPAPTYGTPTKADFKLTVKVLSKQCFGSAGCNLTYRILVAYSGPDLDPSATYEVLYQVRGGEDGPVDNMLTVEGTQSSVDEEESVSTKSSKTKLTAVVTDVLSR